MKLKEVKKLSDAKLRLRVAYLLGWDKNDWADKHYPWKNYLTHTVAKRIPNYPKDLNAMRDADEDAAKTVSHYWALWANNMYKVLFGEKLPRTRSMTMGTVVLATARQRAEAFVLTFKES